MYVHFRELMVMCSACIHFVHIWVILTVVERYCKLCASVHLLCLCKCVDKRMCVFMCSCVCVFISSTDGSVCSLCV